MTTVNPEIQKYWKTSSDDLSGYWFDAYGWIACYFAQLEGLSYALIEKLASPSENARLTALHYKDRTKEASRLVCAYATAKGDTKLADDWAQFLAEAQAAATMRNRILHNPLSVNLSLGDPLHDVEAGVVLTKQRGKPVLKLGAVQQFADSMLNLNQRMQSLIIRTGLD